MTATDFVVRIAETRSDVSICLMVMMALMGSVVRRVLIFIGKRLVLNRVYQSVCGVFMLAWQEESLAMMRLFVFREHLIWFSCEANS